jgi:hypothetical protein
VKTSRDSLVTIEGRDIEQVLPRKYSHKTELTVRAIVLQKQLYGSNVPAIVTNAIPLVDSGATTAVSQRRCLLPEEADTEGVAMAAVEAEAQRLLLLPQQSPQEPVQS